MEVQGARLEGKISLGDRRAEDRGICFGDFQVAGFDLTNLGINF